MVSKKVQENREQLYVIGTIVIICLLLLNSIFLVYLIVNKNVWFTKEELKLESHFVTDFEPEDMADYYDIESYGKEVVEYICSDEVIVSDFRHMDSPIYFKVEGEGVNGTCILIKKTILQRIVELA